LRGALDHALLQPFIQPVDFLLCPLAFRDVAQNNCVNFLSSNINL
jgi:hypothetical protein